MMPPLIMTKEEILHLGTLARIKLSEEEAARLNEEINAILQYIGAVNEIVAESGLTKTVGPVHNVFREDEITNEPGSYTQDIIDQFPQSEGSYLRVKKILNPDN